MSNMDCGLRGDRRLNDDEMLDMAIRDLKNAHKWDVSNSRAVPDRTGKPGAAGTLCGGIRHQGRHRDS